MPELAASYLVGFCLVMIASGFMILAERRVMGSSGMRHIQGNLAQVGLRFSHSRDSLIPLEEASSSSKCSSQQDGMILLSVGCAFLSWVGFFFIILMWFSLAKLGQKRRRHLLGSRLAQSHLETVEIQKILHDLEKTESL